MRCLTKAGHEFTPNHLSLGISAYIADTKAQAVKEMGPYELYFNRALFSHGSFNATEKQRKAGYVSQSSTDYVRPENLSAVAMPREIMRNMTIEDVARRAEDLPWGTAKEVTERIIAAGEHAGANMVQISLNRGAMPHEMFIEQIRRFAREVLPALQAHEVTGPPAELTPPG